MREDHLSLLPQSLSLKGQPKTIQEHHTLRGARVRDTSGGWDSNGSLCLLCRWKRVGRLGAWDGAARTRPAAKVEARPGPFMKCPRLHCSVLSLRRLETCIPDSPSRCGSGVELDKGDPGLWSRKQRAAGSSGGQTWRVPTLLWSSSRSSRQQLDIYCPAVVGWGYDHCPFVDKPRAPYKV